MARRSREPWRWPLKCRSRLGGASRDRLRVPSKEGRTKCRLGLRRPRPKLSSDRPNFGSARPHSKIEKIKIPSRFGFDRICSPALGSTKVWLRSTTAWLRPTRPGLGTAKFGLHSTGSALGSTKSGSRSTESALGSTKPVLRSATSALGLANFGSGSIKSCSAKSRAHSARCESGQTKYAPGSTKCWCGFSQSRSSTYVRWARRSVCSLGRPGGRGRNEASSELPAESGHSRLGSRRAAALALVLELELIPVFASRPCRAEVGSQTPKIAPTLQAERERLVVVSVRALGEPLGRPPAENAQS